MGASQSVLRIQKPSHLGDRTHALRVRTSVSGLSGSGLSSIASTRESYGRLGLSARAGFLAGDGRRPHSLPLTVYRSLLPNPHRHRVRRGAFGTNSIERGDDYEGGRGGIANGDHRDEAASRVRCQAFSSMRKGGIAGVGRLGDVDIESCRDRVSPANADAGRGDRFRRKRPRPDVRTIRSIPFLHWN